MANNNAKQKNSASQALEPQAHTLTPEQSNKVMGILMFLTLPVLFFVLSKCSPLSAPTEPAYKAEERQESERESKAFGCAQIELRSMLKAPSTLEFQFDTISIRESADHDFSISGDFDAQNSFGAMLRQSFRCRVTTTNNNQCTEANCTIL
jgi:hypothetical protein